MQSRAENDLQSEREAQGLKAYDVTFWCNHPQYVTATFHAATAQEAIEMARADLWQADGWEYCDAADDPHFAVAEPNIDLHADSDNPNEFAKWSSDEAKDTATKAMLAALLQLRAWEELMGGFEGKAWREAKEAIAQAQDAGVAP